MGGVSPSRSRRADRPASPLVGFAYLSRSVLHRDEELLPLIRDARLKPSERQAALIREIETVLKAEDDGSVSNEELRALEGCRADGTFVLSWLAHRGGGLWCDLGGRPMPRSSSRAIGDYTAADPQTPYRLSPNRKRPRGYHSTIVHRRFRSTEIASGVHVGLATRRPAALLGPRTAF